MVVDPGSMVVVMVGFVWWWWCGGYVWWWWWYGVGVVVVEVWCGMVPVVW